MTLDKDICSPRLWRGLLGCSTGDTAGPHLLALAARTLASWVSKAVHDTLWLTAVCGSQEHFPPTYGEEALGCENFPKP